MSQEKRKNGFRIAARALRQLGAELITSDDVALNELVKNAFDARSPRVSVAISATADINALEVLIDGLASGKLVASTALDRLSKAIAADLGPAQRNQITLDATAAARKGSSALSHYLQALRASQSLQVTDTGKGMSRDDLANRFLVIGTPGKFLERRLSDGDAAPILGDKGIGRLSMMRLGNLANVRSSRSGDRRWNQIEFQWNKFDDPQLYLDDVEVEVSELAKEDPIDQGTVITVREVVANWNKEKVDGFIDRYMRRLQDPFAINRRPYPVDIFLNGKRQRIAAIPNWLVACAQFSAEIIFDPNGLDGSNQVLRRSIRWRGTASDEIRTWSLADLTGELEISAATFARLGPFTGHCLWFNRNLLSYNNVDKTRIEIGTELNNWCGGFSVYRDNFRVGKTGGMEDDWLEWDSGALRSKGFALNRYQTVGSVSISSANNPHLIDSANRERLIACPEQELLKRLLGAVIVRDFRMHINTVREAEAKIAIAEESTTESLKASEDSLKRTIRQVGEIAKLVPKNERHQIDEIRATLQGQVEYVKTIKNSLEMARETRVELLELANIGLVVEIVVHELSRLTERTSELLTDLQRGGEKADVVGIVDNLRSQMLATNKRIRTVDAMSPSGRQRKESYDAIAQTHTIVNGFKSRFKRHEIECRVLVDGGDAKKSLDVYMVKGLIAQVLENLLTNSVYWLQQGLVSGDSERRILIDLDTKALALHISDNGPGIDPKYGKEVFRPYYSTRRKGKGLGLYIASELVAYHGGKLYMDSAEDSDGRLRTFILELPRESK